MKKTFREWIKAIRDIKNNLDIQPTSEKAKRLVENWVNQADKMYGNDEDPWGSVGGLAKFKGRLSFTQ